MICFLCQATEGVKVVEVEVNTIAGKMRDSIPMCDDCKEKREGKDD